MSMKCLSIRQPWASLIIYDGKDIENRTWPTSYRGPVLVHAAMKPDDIIDHTMSQGGIIGIVDVVDCVTQSSSRWWHGPYGFVLKNARPLPFMPCKGRLGFFAPPENVRKLLAQEGIPCT